MRHPPVVLALAYWVIDGLFGAMGTVNYLPAAIAAWSSDILFCYSRRLPSPPHTDINPTKIVR